MLSFVTLRHTALSFSVLLIFTCEMDLLQTAIGAIMLHSKQPTQIFFSLVVCGWAGVRQISAGPGPGLHIESRSFIPVSHWGRGWVAGAIWHAFLLMDNRTVRQQRKHLLLLTASAWKWHTTLYTHISSVKASPRAKADIKEEASSHLLQWELLQSHKEKATYI